MLAGRKLAHLEDRRLDSFNLAEWRTFLLAREDGVTGWARRERWRTARRWLASNRNRRRAPVTNVATVVKLLDTYKAKLAFLAPLTTAIGTAVASWIVSGDFNASEIRTAAGGAVLAVVSGVAAYLAPAGRAQVE